MKVRYVRGVGRAVMGFAVAAALLQCLGAAAGAQAITGVVTDTSGAVIPGATVVAASPALIEKTRTVVTDSGGEYKLAGLLPGTYSVTYSMKGFNTVKHDNVQLAADFTATVNVALQVGTAEQTVNVTDAPPMVDVADVNAETRLSQAALSVLPISRNPVGFSAVTVGAVIPIGNQDVGGSQGEAWIKLALHGGHGSEQELLLNDYVYNSMIVAGRLFFPNSISTEEFTIGNGEGGSAEERGAGANINTVSKDGSNQFHGLFDMSGTTHSLQGNNLTPYLVSRGLVVSNSINQLFDIGAGVGGRIIKDRLWFYAAYRNWGNKESGASLQYNADPNSYTYTPNGVPVLQTNYYRNANLRLTWQASPRNKVTYETDVERNHLGNDASANLFGHNPPISPEADTFGRYEPEILTQITWTMLVSPKLLLDAGVQYFYGNVENPAQKYAASNLIGVTDTGLGITYRAPVGAYDTFIEDPTQQVRASATYVTGAHQYKVGAMVEHAWEDEDTSYDSQAISYTFNNAVPTSLTEYAAAFPRLHQKWVMWPTIGLYAQDQWAIKHRLTVSYGLRFDHRGDYIPANANPAGVFVPVRNYPHVGCVPCWNDFSPRVGGSYDVRRNGKTVIKASIGRYVLQQTVQLAQANDPVATVASSTTRSWHDSLLSEGNYTPQCDLTNPAANGDCGAVANKAFGSSVVTTKYDPAVLNGWQHSPYNWQMSAGVEQMLGSRVAVSAMYYRTWYGNFTVTDNLDTPPSDYSPYCITAPVNSRLPHGGGYQICGLYDLNPAQVGEVNNYVTFASHFGKQTEIYNGVDLKVRVRLGSRFQLDGGLNIGNSNGTTSSQSDCFVVNSPQQLYQCNQPYPEQAQVKFQGVYRLPWSVEFSGTVQSLPGAPISATYAAPNSIIAPSLGRNLSACGTSTTCTATASVQLIQPNTMWESRLNQVDVQFTRPVHIRDRVTIKPTAILANLLNGSAITGDNVTYGAKWLTPTSVLYPRLARFGIRIEF